MKKAAAQIKALLKDRKINAQVKVQGDLIIIDNLPPMTNADAIASIACSGEWVYMSQSMTKRKKPMTAEQYYSEQAVKNNYND